MTSCAVETDHATFSRTSVVSSTILSFPAIAVSKGTAPLQLVFSSLFRVLRNSSLFIGVGWVFGYCFTVGNVFSRLPPREQSAASFSAANMAWWYGVFSACMIIIISAKLPREQFVLCSSTRVAMEGTSMPSTRRLNLLQCIRKLLRPTAPFLLIGAVGAVGGEFLLYSLMPRSWYQFKLSLYIAMFWGFFSMVIVDVYARRIFQTETVRGLVATSVQLSHQSRQGNRLKRHWRPSLKRFLHVYKQNLPVAVFAMVSIMYVHVVSRFIGSTGQWGLLAFSSASIVLKLALQELAKHILIIVRRPVSRRVMVAFISTPTIIVDTQVRVLLLRQVNLKFSAAGTLFIAIFEIVIRTTKSVMIRRQTREPLVTLNQHRLPLLQLPPGLLMVGPNNTTQVIPVARISPTDKVQNDIATRLHRSSTRETPAEYKARRDAMERRRKTRVLHVGETYADMYAEYIAIGCSFVMTYFYRNHPHYEFSILLSGSSDQAGNLTADATTTREQQLIYLGYFQMSVEVVVDFLACVLEAVHDVDFKSFDQNDPFLIFFLAMLTFSNIAICTGLYMH